jgi:hypothetical protein
MALRLASRGYKHYSHDTLISVIRFQHDVRTDGHPFKIANELKAFYGRKWMQTHADRYPGFFSLRQIQGEPDRVFARYTGAE